MEIDLLLPSSLFAIVALSILFYERIQNKMKSIFESKKIGMREVVLMVISMGIMVTVIALIPNYAIQIIFIAAYSYMLLVFTYIVLGRIFLAFLPPAIFVAAYLLIKNFFMMNVFTALFAVMVIAYLNSLFSWRVTMIFAFLLTLMDSVQVFWTGHMLEAANKMIGLHLPVALILPTYPSYRLVALGLGDIFLSGLLSAQTASKYGRGKGLITAATISATLFTFEIFMLNVEMGAQGFPATIIVLLGWFLGMLPIFLRRLAEKSAGKHA